MKQITLLCLEDDRAQTLQALQELGVLHLHYLAIPESRDVEILRRELESTKDCIRLLSRMLDDSEKDLLQLTPPQESPSQAVDQVRILQARKKNLEEKKDALSAEKTKLAPFGDFEAQTIHDLAENGIFVRLYHIPSRDLPEAPEGAVLSVLHSDMQGHAVALIDTNPSSSLDAREFTPPSRSLSELETELNETIADLNCVQEEFERRVPLIDQIRQYQTSIEDQTALAEARAGMQASEKIAYLQGFCPVPKLDTLSQAAKSHGWGLVIEEPDPDLRVPTLIQNPGWVRPIRAVFDMIGIMPGYDEVDISALFLLFLSLFFAILVGDAGYGILFLGLTALLRAKNKTAPPEAFRLLGIFSVATIIWGVLTGNYFGINPSFLPAPLAALRLDWLSPDAIGQDAADANFMTLTFLIGAIHLSIAHLWNFVRTINSTRALAQLGWICLTWTMFFMARFMVLSVPLPGFVPWLFVIGLILIVIFMTPFRELKKEWTGHVMLALDVISNFVDVVSYVRLFAVGSASLAVAVAFNQMAIGNGINSILSGVIAAIILFMGHALNILLCAMGVLVHGVRLNTLEFSGHVGMQWAGFKYNPFARRAQPNQDLTQSVE
jgi:V/A-type H+-transporting ATPase subunit I